MKKLAIAAAVVGVIGLGLLLAEKFPVRFVVERSAAVPATPEAVFARLSDLRNFPAWSKLTRKHVAGSDHFEGTGVGATWSFVREGSGEPGKVQLDVLEPPRRIELHAVDAPPANPKIAWTIEPAGTGSKLTLRFEGELRLLGKLARLIKPPEEVIGKLLEEELAAFNATPMAP